MSFAESFAQAFKPAEAVMAGFTMAERKKDRELKEAREKREQEKFKYEIEGLQTQSELNKMMLRNKKMQREVVNMKAAMDSGNTEGVIKAAMSADNLTDNGIHTIAVVSPGSWNEDQKAEFFANNPTLENQRDSKYIARVWDDVNQTENYKGFKNDNDLLNYYASMADPEQSFKLHTEMNAIAEKANAAAPVQVVVAPDGTRSYFKSDMSRDEDGKMITKKVVITPEAAAKYDPSKLVESYQEALEREKAPLTLEGLRADIDYKRALTAKALREKDGKDKSPLTDLKSRQTLAKEYMATLMARAGYAQDEAFNWVETEGGKPVPNNIIEAAQKKATELVRFGERAGATDIEESLNLYDRVSGIQSKIRETKKQMSDLEKSSKYGLRADGTPKGSGYFGELKMKDKSGDVATELSVGIEIDGRETQIPLLVPTLTEREKDYLLQGNKATEQILSKAVEHAYSRLDKGLSPFAEDEDINRRKRTKSQSVIESRAGRKL